MEPGDEASYHVRAPLAKTRGLRALSLLPSTCLASVWFGTIIDIYGTMNLSITNYKAEQKISV